MCLLTSSSENGVNTLYTHRKVTSVVSLSTSNVSVEEKNEYSLGVGDVDLIPRLTTVTSYGNSGGRVGHRVHGGRSVGMHAFGKRLF